MNWNEVLDRQDILGGELKIRYRGELFHGPIQDIGKLFDKIIVVAEWMQSCGERTENSVKYPVNYIMVNPRIEPRINEKGEICINGEHDVSATICPRNQTKTDFCQNDYS